MGPNPVLCRDGGRKKKKEKKSTWEAAVNCQGWWQQQLLPRGPRCLRGKEGGSWHHLRGREGAGGLRRGSQCPGGRVFQSLLGGILFEVGYWHFSKWDEALEGKCSCRSKRGWGLVYQRLNSQYLLRFKSYPRCSCSDFQRQTSPQLKLASVRVLARHCSPLSWQQPCSNGRGENLSFWYQTVKKNKRLVTRKWKPCLELLEIRLAWK